MNTATVAAPAGTTDTNSANNSATDTDLIVPPLPALTVLDNFNRANANTLGASWSQTTLFGLAAIRVNATRPRTRCCPDRRSGTSRRPASARTRAPPSRSPTPRPASGANQPTLVLKATRRLHQQPGQLHRRVVREREVTVATTTNSGGTLTPRATFAATFANGDTLSAVADGTGAVSVYKTSGATTTAVGSVAIPTSGTGAWTQGTGGGRIGIQLPISQRIDDFAGGTLP